MVDYGWKKGGLIEYISERSDTYYWNRSNLFLNPKQIRSEKFVLYGGLNFIEAFNKAFEETNKNFKTK